MEKEKISYDTLHHWLYRAYGKAKKCENINCKFPNPKKFTWALLKGKKYERKRENFWQLCYSCHNYYDQIAQRKWEKERINKRGMILKIRDAYRKNIPQRKIAKLFGYTQSNISRIVNHDTWRTV